MRAASRGLLLVPLLCGELPIAADGPADALGTGGDPSPLVPGPGGAVLVGAGDIAFCGPTADEATAALLDSIPGTIFTVGDHVYPHGSAADFADCYGPSWGRHRDRTRPTPGNHDYETPGAAGYFGYFGDAAGDPTRGYYSYDVGDWHIVALNSVIDVSRSSPQIAWLKADLAASGARCTLAYVHNPRFSSGRERGGPNLRPTWQVLYEAGAEVVVSGHSHDYERFAPQTPSGMADSANGIRQFVAGTGGANLHPFRGVTRNSQVRNSSTNGVLQLVLYPDRYEWRFVPVRGSTFTDTGVTRCH